MKASPKIPFARELLENALELGVMDDYTRSAIQFALPLMCRDAACGRVPSTPIEITDEIRAEVFALRRAGMSMHNISEHTGLHNIGRVSEILRKLR